MRFFWSVVLVGGLLLVGLDVYESRRDPAPAALMVEDGTPLPPPPPPP